MLQKIVDGRTDLVIDYLADGNSPDSTDTNGVSLIKWCAYYGDVTAIKQLVLAGESLEAMGPNFDLNGACFHGHWRLVQYLIEQGADVNFPIPESGETPLHNSLCKPNNPKYDFVIEVLLANGADPNIRAKENAETGAFMRDVRTKGETPLHRAAAFANARSIDLLIAADADIGARDMHGDSPLSWASWHMRSAFILQKLTFGDHYVGAAHIKSDKESGGQGAMELHLLGKPHHD